MIWYDTVTMELLLAICRRTMSGRNALLVTWCSAFHAPRSAWMEVDMGLIVETNKEAAAAGNDAATARNTESVINAYLE